MALKKATLKTVDKLVDRFMSYLKYRSIGPHALSQAQLKDLVREGLVKPGAPGAHVATAYLKAHEQLAEIAAPRTHREGAIKFLERMFERYADKAGEQLKADVMSTIETTLMPFMNRAEGKAVYEALKDKDFHAKRLTEELKGKVENIANRWKMIVNTELARATNYGAMDAIITNNKGTPSDQVIVYKVGPHDGDVCKHCLKFWFLDDGITPKVYRLSELMANGSNIGRKQAEWRPTVDITHPNERHWLMELKPGFGFEEGRLVYVSKQHDEYLTQRRR